MPEPKPSFPICSDGLDAPIGQPSRRLCTLASGPAPSLQMAVGVWVLVRVGGSPPPETTVSTLGRHSVGEGAQGPESEAPGERGTATRTGKLQIRGVDHDIQQDDDPKEAQPQREAGIRCRQHSQDARHRNARKNSENAKPSQKTHSSPCFGIPIGTRCHVGSVSRLHINVVPRPACEPAMYGPPPIAQQPHISRITTSRSCASLSTRSGASFAQDHAAECAGSNTPASRRNLRPRWLQPTRSASSESGGRSA